MFLGAGSVMHALPGELDIRKMGNLRAKLPTTYWTFLIGAAALAGIPLLSGFFSKDEILWSAWQRSPLLWVVGIATAVLTAVYSFRAVFVPFWGQERDKKLFNHAHESPRVMTVPLIILAVGAALAGYLGIPHLSLIERWLEPVFAAAANTVELPASPIEWVLMALSGLVASAARTWPTAPTWWTPEIPKRVRASLGWFATLVENKYYVDEAYNKVIVQPLRDLSGWFAGTFDQRGIDGAVNGVAGATGWVGHQARRLQTGMVGLYALSILFGAVALLAWLVIR